MTKSRGGPDPVRNRESAAFGVLTTTGIAKESQSAGIAKEVNTHAYREFLEEFDHVRVAR